MARSIDDVDTLVLPGEELGNPFFNALVPTAGHRCGSNRDAPLTFLLHMVSGRGTIVHLTDPMDHARIKENPLGKRGLARIDVRSNPNVPGPLKRHGTGGDFCDFRHQFRADEDSSGDQLETEVGEGTVGLGHLVHIITLTNGVSRIVGSVFDLVGESDVHWSALLGTGIVDDPTHSQ
jgi:hypothetical protein